MSTFHKLGGQPSATTKHFILKNKERYFCNFLQQFNFLLCIPRLMRPPHDKHAIIVSE